MAARFLEDRPPLSEDPRRAAIRGAHRADEAACVAGLLELAAVDDRTRARIRARALELAGRVGAPAAISSASRRSCTNTS